MVLNGTEALSAAVGRLTDRLVRRVVKKQALAFCGVYCFIDTCGYPSCANTQPDLYHCHDYCSGYAWYQCFPYQPYYCAGFCDSLTC